MCFGNDRYVLPMNQHSCILVGTIDSIAVARASSSCDILPEVTFARMLLQPIYYKVL
jgi:hypothetical protein